MPTSLTTIDQFQGLEGQAFEVRQGDATPLRLVLTEVSDDTDLLGRRAVAHLTRTPFTLIFRGPLQPVLPQGTYRLHHPGPGELEQLLVPIADLRRDGIYYQVVYN